MHDPLPTPKPGRTLGVRAYGSSKPAPGGRGARHQAHTPRVGLMSVNNASSCEPTRDRGRYSWIFESTGNWHEQQVGPFAAAGWLRCVAIRLGADRD